MYINSVIVTSFYAPNFAGNRSHILMVSYFEVIKILLVTLNTQLDAPIMDANSEINSAYKCEAYGPTVCEELIQIYGANKSM